MFVGNGEALLCSNVSRHTKLEVQGTIFQVDLHILPIHGPDVILGMDWLESLGKVTADFVGKTLEFTLGDKAISLKGILQPPREIGLHSLSTLFPPTAGMDYFKILLLDPEQATTGPADGEPFPADIPPGVLSVLEKFKPVFSLPNGMPPKRPIDHQVHLLPGTHPINVRPYRYPYFQKNEIERQVKDMLEQGIISGVVALSRHQSFLFAKRTALSGSASITAC